MQLTFPSKTWLLGEYAVLGGGPGLMLGHGPHFRAELRAGAPHSSFHPQSPAGRWLARHPYSGSIRFSDPHEGAGGFGGSGAEFLAAWLAGRALPASSEERAALAREAWLASREFPGSGADILTQACGVNRAEPFLARVDCGAGKVQEIPLALGLTISLFHTGRKLATHDHLRRLPELPFAKLGALVSDAEGAVREKDGLRLARALREFAATLADLGLLAPHSAQALAMLPRRGVLAAKGCGAMGADVLLVLHEGIDLAAYAVENSLAEVARLPV